MRPLTVRYHERRDAERRARGMFGCATPAGNIEVIVTDHVRHHPP
jgi:hypothetical protein